MVSFDYIYNDIYNFEIYIYVFLKIQIKKNNNNNRQENIKYELY